MVNNRARVVTASVLALAVAQGGGARAVASILGPDGVIHGCYKRSGALRVVSASQTCRRAEQAIEWNPQGPPGVVGPRGEQGAQGDVGLPGPSDAWFDFNDGQEVISGGTTLDTVTPPPGPLTVFGKVVLNYHTSPGLFSNVTVTCDLNEGGLLRDRAVVGIGNTNFTDEPDVTVNLQYANVTSGYPVTLSCSFTPVVFATITASFSKITAIQVATLH